MTRGKDWLRSNAPVIYAVLVALALLIGLGAGLVLARWLWPPYAPEATPTAPARPTTVGEVTATPLPGTPPAEGAAPSATATPCGPPPAGWVPYAVQPGDTLSELAERAGVSQERVMQVNCLDSPELLFGQPIYLPPLPTPTPCGPLPAGWLPYTVKPGDTLSGLAERAGVSPEQVTAANCLDSPDLLAGQVIHLPPLPPPTPTPCVPAPPAGWVLYTVRPGDTLFSLAVTRDTTTAEVMRVNCLDSAELWAGQGIYLPSLPITAEPPPTVPPQPPGEVAEGSSFSGKPDGSGLPPLKLPPGGPGDPNFVPCRSGENLEFDTPIKTVELGQRRYLYVCLSNPASAQVTRSDGLSQQVEMLTTIPNPDLQMGSAQAVIDWAALPFQPLGDYTLVVTNSNGVAAPFVFRVITPTTQRILTVPATGPRGTVFLVYYVNFDLNTSPEFVFYGEDEPAPGVDHTATYRDRWQVPITQPLGAGKGWEQVPLVSTVADCSGGYSITYDNKRIYNLFWLTVSADGSDCAGR